MQEEKAVRWTLPPFFGVPSGFLAKNEFQAIPTCFWKGSISMKSTIRRIGTGRGRPFLDLRTHRCDKACDAFAPALLGGISALEVQSRVFKPDFKEVLRVLLYYFSFGTFEIGFGARIPKRSPKIIENRKTQHKFRCSSFFRLFGSPKFEQKAWKPFGF